MPRSRCWGRPRMRRNAALIAHAGLRIVQSWSGDGSDSTASGMACRASHCLTGSHVRPRAGSATGTAGRGRGLRRDSDLDDVRADLPEERWSCWITSPAAVTWGRTGRRPRISTSPARSSTVCRGGGVADAESSWCGGTGRYPYIEEMTRYPCRTSPQQRLQLRRDRPDHTRPRRAA